MKTLRPLLAFVLLAPVAALAQGTSNNPSNSAAKPPPAGANLSPADRDWAVVEARQKAAVQFDQTRAAMHAKNAAALSAARAAGKAPTLTSAQAAAQAAAQFTSEKLQRAQTARWLAQGARDFYTRNPTDLRAAAARKIEALAVIDGITDTDKTYEQSALKLAGDYRTNKVNPASDRYQVAHAMERRGVSKKLAGASWLSHPAEAEMMADRLHAEFGELPEVYGCYLAVAEGVNCDAGRDVALRLLQMPAPASIKAAAQRLLDRFRLVRQPLDFPLTPDRGKATTLAKLAGKTTVVCFWDGAHDPAGPPGLADFKKNPRPNTEWIYVSLGTPAPLAPGAKAHLTPPGTTCVEPLGFQSPLAAQLKINRLPFVLVLDDKQNLTGYGRVDELPWLLANPNRLIAP